MIYLIYILLIISFMFLVNATINLLFSQKLKKGNKDPLKLVSILIPARNEEKNIAILLDSIQKLEYKNIEILVFDDQSTDNTGKIVSELSEAYPNIRLISSPGLQKGWLGKNFACHSLANEAKGDYFLFVDADVILEKGIVNDSVELCERDGIGLLSIFPKQVMPTYGEKITVPIMNYILLTLLPLILVRYSPFASHSAANGQFMFFRADYYSRQKPHEFFKDSPVEDIKIARLFKKKKIKTVCLGYDNRVLCRMYKNYSEALNGFSKNVFMFFGGNSFLSILYWATTTLGFLPMLFVNIKFLLLYIPIIIVTRAIVSLASGQNAATNLLLMPLQQLFLLHVIIIALINSKKKTHTWKERNIYS